MNKYQVESINDKSNEYPDLDLAASEIFYGKRSAESSGTVHTQRSENKATRLRLSVACGSAYAIGLGGP